MIQLTKEPRCTYCNRKFSDVGHSIQTGFDVNYTRHLDVVGEFCSIGCLNGQRRCAYHVKPMSYQQCLWVLRSIPLKEIQNYLAKDEIFVFGPKEEVIKMVAQQNWTYKMHQELQEMAIHYETLQRDVRRAQVQVLDLMKRIGWGLYRKKGKDFDKRLARVFENYEIRTTGNKTSG